MMSPALIRTPTLGDADALARVHLACWLQTYSGLVSPAVLESFSLEERTANWVRVLTTTTNARYLAEVDGEVVGFSASGASRREHEPRALELYAIYVLAEHHGTGIGQQLIEAAVDREPAVVWLAVGNERAAAFYRRNGFEADGGTGLFEKWDDLPEFRMVR
jgi:ribosomal protein S18 acetylase RimI-like enzyme